LENWLECVSSPFKAGCIFNELKKYLSPSGRVTIIEHLQKNVNHVSVFKHYTPEENILKIMAECGYYKVESFDFLEKQSFNIFKADSSPQ